MKKLRFFFIDNETRRPIQGLRVSGEVRLQARSKDSKHEVLPLSVLTSNIDGYVSFSPSLCDDAELRSVRIFLHGKKAEVWKFKAANLGHPSSSPFEVEVNEDFYEELNLNNRGLSVEQPDRWDFSYTNLANRGTELIIGNGDCSQMVPQHVQRECYELFQVVPSPLLKKELRLVGPKGEIDVACADLMLSEVCWDWLGYSLGKLVNSFSLAPCETQKILVKAWRVDQEAYSESTQTDQFRESFIQESMSQSVRNLDIGLSVNPPSSGGGSSDDKAFAIWEKIVGIVFQSSGSGSSSPTNLVNIGIKNQKSLVNQIQRTTNRLSTKHRISVQRETTEGASRTQKRTLVNQNQCHSTTTNMYEVVNNFEVTVCTKEKRNGLMIKYPNDPFTKKKIFCHRHLFKNNLLDPALEHCLDSIGKIVSCCEPNEDDECPKVDKLHVRLTIGDVGTGSLIRVILVINGSHKDFFIPRNGDRYKQGHTYELAIDLGGEICVENITEVGIHNDADNRLDGALNFERLSIDYSSSAFSGKKPFFMHGFHGKVKREKIVMLGPSTPEIPNKQEPLNVCSIEEMCCSRQLLDHFNCNQLYYNQIIWRFENPHERIVRFEEYRLNGRPLSYEIINYPVAVHGQWVVFEFSDSDPRAVQPAISTHTIVSLPTAGLFQETLLGSCGSCEEPDIPVLKARKKYPCSCGCD